MSGDDFEISVGDVSDAAATVCVRYLAAADAMVRLSGTLRGPYCERMRTLAAEFTFREVAGQPGMAAAQVVDPCLWSPELPHLYKVHLEVRRGGELLTEYHGTLGLHGPAARQM